MARSAQELFRAGKLTEAIEALRAELRDAPGDLKRRTFLFELLCFAGEYDRAEKQLEILAQEGKQAGLGTLLYRAALHAERLRATMFEKRSFPLVSETQPPSGTYNGQAFDTIEDADPRIGPRLEVFVAGDYLWLPFEHIASIEMEAPKRLRDLLWSPAVIHTGPAFQGKELGEVLLPALSPGSAQYPNDDVRLGRVTEWKRDENGDEVPFGQKMLLVNGEEVPILELRDLQVTVAQAAP